MSRASPAAARPVGRLPVVAACLYALSLSWSKAGCSIGFFLVVISCLALPAPRARLAALRSHPLALPTLVWLAVLLLGVALSPVRLDALEELRAHYPVLLVFLLPAALADARDRRLLGGVLLGGILAAALPAVAQAVGLIDWQPWRFRGTIGVFPYAGLMVFGSALCLWFAVCADRRGWMIAAVAGMLCTSTATWMNGSRIALVATLACGLCVLLMAGGRRLRVLAVTAPLLVIPLICSVTEAGTVLRQRLADTGVALDGQADQERRDLWAAGVRMFQEAPLFGVGMGNFRPRFDAMLAAGELGGGVAEEHVHRTAHSQPLHVLATQGAVGLAGFLYWCVAGVTLLLRGARVDRLRGVPPLLGGVVVAVFGVTDTSLQDSTLFGVLALSLGCAVALRAAAAQQAPAPAAGISSAAPRTG